MTWVEGVFPTWQYHQKVEKNSHEVLEEKKNKKERPETSVLIFLTLWNLFASLLLWHDVHVDIFVYIMRVHFLSWQDIIPVITGNERLWHSHKINAQWQNLCSKASTASFVKWATPPPPTWSKRSHIDNHDYKTRTRMNCVTLVITSTMLKWASWAS